MCYGSPVVAKLTFWLFWTHKIKLFLRLFTIIPKDIMCAFMGMTSTSSCTQQLGYATASTDE